MLGGGGVLGQKLATQSAESDNDLVTVAVFPFPHLSLNDINQNTVTRELRIYLERACSQSRLSLIFLDIPTTKHTFDKVCVGAVGIFVGNSQTLVVV